MDKRIHSLPKIGRRRFLAQLGATVLVAAVPQFALAAATTNRELWLSAEGDSPESFGLAWASSGDMTGCRSATGFRGHTVLQHALHKNSAIFLPRRPGSSALELALDSGEIIGEFNCRPGNYFYGHGCFSQDGQVLFTTESTATASTGRIVARDAQSYEVLDEWSSHGIGPHDIRLLPGGSTLVVANGGIHTRVESGRQPLNLATMNSSLTYIDAGSGALIDAFRIEEAKSSIRHLDVAEDGTVAFAIQLQRESAGHDMSVPLAGVHRPGEAITLFDKPAAVVDRLRDYVGSVAINDTSRIAGFTSPHGNLAVFWNIDNGQFAGYHRLRDVCGIAASPARNTFVISNSFGELRELDAVTLQENGKRRISLPGYRFDNHLTIVQAGQ
jgi:hypothetical protein